MNIKKVATTFEPRPHLDRPGPQPWNMIAGSVEEQLRRARQPRPGPSHALAQRIAEAAHAHPELIGPALFDLLAIDVAELVADLQSEASGGAD
jgi:hypothetical protein